MSAGIERGEEVLDALRSEISELDEELLGLLSRRLAVARRIGEEKRAQGLPVQDLERQAAVVRRAGERARELGLDDESDDLAAGSDLASDFVAESEVAGFSLVSVLVAPPGRLSRLSLR